MGFFDLFKQSNINQGIEEYKRTDDAVLLLSLIHIFAAGSIYGKSESGNKEGEPDVVGTFSVNLDENITVVANRKNIEMCIRDSFISG